MRQIVIALCLTLMTAGGLRADPDSIRNVIGDQIGAFLRDDFAGAFSYASPNIQRIFRTPDNFGGMVRQGYPMVWRPADVEYLDIEPKGEAMMQRVLIVDEAGQRHLLEYRMIELESGWKIDGVRVIKDLPGMA